MTCLFHCKSMNSFCGVCGELDIIDELIFLICDSSLELEYHVIRNDCTS